MPQLNEVEYAIIAKSLLTASNYIKSDTELGKQIAEAIQILKQSAKGVNFTPTGASAVSDDKLIIDSVSMIKDGSRRPT